jgi:iron-sulfur cluster insertion protein
MTPVQLSENAARRIHFLRNKRGNPHLKLRLSVLSGGCSGMQYQFGFEDKAADDDQIFTAHGVDLLVDTTSLEFIGGSVVDYQEELSGAAFTVTNPNAAMGCGCGNSFMTK